MLQKLWKEIIHRNMVCILKTYIYLCKYCVSTLFVLSGPNIAKIP